MSETNAGDLGSAVRVVVTPSQSSYFAGEPFSVTVTFTNTRSPDAPPPRSFSHTRAAHSISSAPLARPPTSPGTPRTPAPPTPSRVLKGSNNIVRKGLIGKHRQSNDLDGISHLVSLKSKKLQTRSLSVSISARDIENLVVDAEPGLATPLDSSTSQPNRSPISPIMRSSSLPLSPNHPHARKSSVLDGNLQLHEMSNSLPPSPYALSASTSAFSLILDPIAENTSLPYPPSPLSASPAVETIAAATSTRPFQSKHARKPPQIGLGQPSKLNVPRTAFSASFPQSNSELILYSYAQLTGTVIITPPPGITATPAQVNTLHSLRSSLVKRSAVGGGSMDITSSLQQQQQSHRRRPSHRRSASLSAGLLSLLSPTTLVASASSPSATPSSSTFSSLLSPSPSANGGDDKVGLGIFVEDEVKPETPLPTFEVQPTMLAVDLCLLPGESRSFMYSLPLPDNLPPTFRGRTMKFSYELVVGTCRAGSPSPGSPKLAGVNSISRVMKVPIRVYNNVVIGRSPKPYDLLWPILKPPKPAKDSGAKAAEVERLTKSVDQIHGSPGRYSCGSYSELQDYARKVSAALAESDATGEPGIQPVPKELDQELDREEGGLTGCREAVELLTRNPKKVSYDVNKDGVNVAVLTFTKSAYRLGETALGVLELNERTAPTRVLQLSAILESQESLPSSISPQAHSRQMRRVHAEHHSSFTLFNLRTTFSLDIPSDASPDFEVNMTKDTELGGSKSGGLEWKVRLCLLVAVASESSLTSSEGVRFKSLVRDGLRGQWGSSWKATSGISPLEQMDPRLRRHEAPKRSSSWTSFFAASFLGVSEYEGEGDGDDRSVGDDDRDYDGIRGSKEGGVGVGVNFGGGEEGWHDLRLETVECEVPIKVSPGNTAFKAVEVTFHV